MLKYLLILFLPLSVAVASCQTSRPAGSSAQVDSERLDNSLLWRIEGKGARTSYLFGTIHIIDEEDYFLPEGTNEIIAQSDKVVFEIDLDEMNDLGAQLSLFTKAFMPNGMTIRDLLNEEDYALVEDYFQGMGMPMFIMGKLKPMFLSIFATGDFAPDDLTSGAWKSYEMEFYEVAQGRNIPVEGLETLEYQMGVFDEIPYEEQAEMLVDMIRAQDEGSEEFAKLIAAYKSQDIEMLSELINSAEGGLADHEDVLIRKRNENWIPLMGEHMKQGKIFFAVGAGHLAGRYGVIPLLRKAGYEVSPVKTAAVNQGKGKI